MTATMRTRSPATRLVAWLIGSIVLFGAGVVIAADVPKPTVTTATPAFKPARPYWVELDPTQRTVLAPLADDWERLDSQTKKKWIEIARRYPKMGADEQQRTQQRMREWALLTPEQRRVARDSFARVRAMPPQQRAEVLQRYRELPEERKDALAKEGRAARTITVPKPEASPPATHRTQIREGAKTVNPAVARKELADAKARAALPPPATVAVPPAAPTEPAAPATEPTSAAKPLQ